MNALESVTILLDGQIIGGETSVSNSTTDTSTGTDPTVTDETAVVEEGSGAFTLVTTVLMYAALFGALYFFMFRPNKKREKETKEMQESLKLGDSVLTTGGLFGKVITVGTDSIMVEFGENRGVRVWVRKAEILGIRTPVMTPPPTPSPEEAKKDKKKKKDKDEN